MELDKKAARLRGEKAEPLSGSCAVPTLVDIGNCPDVEGQGALSDDAYCHLLEAQSTRRDSAFYLERRTTSRDVPCVGTCASVERIGLSGTSPALILHDCTPWATISERKRVARISSNA